MTVIIEDTEDVPCSHCDLIRKSFIVIAVSAVVPMVFFAALLLLATIGTIDAYMKNSTSMIVEFIFGLLYVQLFVATSILIVSFRKSRYPILKYHYWYLIFHVVVMAMFICSCLLMMAINEAYTLCGIVVFGGVLYFYGVRRFLNRNRHMWTNLRRLY
ncbi:Uncharacterized protein OBRU01_05214 [Operophtera brumata]|uniref:Uncharacterized protein n=1 Tax=Operophtera brumata TaxID=104452 RepID=A0A0L7L4M2_OPEBR|nr:Uncharacterized protein OBRU01_05214 [Operophtera brumata]